MTILNVRQNISWVPHPNTVELRALSNLPDAHLMSSAYVLAFDQDNRVLLADLNRGWDIPGGHIDPGETAEEAARREAQEETGAIIGEMELIAGQYIIMEGDKPKDYKYPFPLSVQPLFMSTDFTLGEFTQDEDSFGRGFFTLDEIKKKNLIPNGQLVVELALSRL